MTRERLEAAMCVAPTLTGRLNQARRVDAIEEYLWIGGPHMTVPAAAARLGRTERTIRRYRAVLREMS